MTTAVGKRGMSRQQVALVVAVLLAVELLVPQSAAAFSLNPADWVVDGFKAILRFIFGDVAELGRQFMNLLLAVPLLTDKGKFPRLNEYREYVEVGAYALLTLTLFLAFARHWLAGFTGNGGMEALIGVARGAVAVGILLLFEPAFDGISRITNAFTAALIDNPVVGRGLGSGVVKLLSDQSLDGGIMMLLSIVAIAMAIVLLLIKVIVIAVLAVLFVASPIAIALWPVDELAWAMRSCFQGLLGLLAFPVMWALCFGAFATLTPDALFPGDHGDLINLVLAPMIGLASLIVAVRFPFAVLRMGMQASISPTSGIRMARDAGYVKRTVGSRGGGGAAKAAKAAA
jgi:hypothetical protein